MARAPAAVQASAWFEAVCEALQAGGILAVHRPLHASLNSNDPHCGALWAWTIARLDRAGHAAAALDLVSYYMMSGGPVGSAFTRTGLRVLFGAGRADEAGMLLGVALTRPELASGPERTRLLTSAARNFLRLRRYRDAEAVLAELPDSAQVRAAAAGTAVSQLALAGYTEEAAAAIARLTRKKAWGSSGLPWEPVREVLKRAAAQADSRTFSAVADLWLTETASSARRGHASTIAKLWLSLRLRDACTAAAVLRVAQEHQAEHGLASAGWATVLASLAEVGSPQLALQVWCHVLGCAGQLTDQLLSQVHPSEDDLARFSDWLDSLPPCALDIPLATVGMGLVAQPLGVDDDEPRAMARVQAVVDWATESGLGPAMPLFNAQFQLLAQGSDIAQAGAVYDRALQAGLHLDRIALLQLHRWHMTQGNVIAAASLLALHAPCLSDKEAILALGAMARPAVAALLQWEAHGVSGSTPAWTTSAGTPVQAAVALPASMQAARSPAPGWVRPAPASSKASVPPTGLHLVQPVASQPAGAAPGTSVAAAAGYWPVPVIRSESEALAAQMALLRAALAVWRVAQAASNAMAAVTASSRDLGMVAAAANAAPPGEFLASSAGGAGGSTAGSASSSGERGLSSDLEGSSSSSGGASSEDEEGTAAEAAQERAMPAPWSKPQRSPLFLEPLLEYFLLSRGLLPRQLSATEHGPAALRPRAAASLRKLPPALQQTAHAQLFHKRQQQQRA